MAVIFPRVSWLPLPPNIIMIMHADAHMGVLDQEGSDWFISSKVNELTRLRQTRRRARP
jgi:hypothetical protein